MLLPYWPEPFVPVYRPGKFGNWQCEQTPVLHNVPGYFLPTPQQPRGWMFKKNDTIWMSLTRMEVESQMMHIAAAKGHVVIAGLGMGFVLFNILRKPEVTQVTLLEVDPEVIQLVDMVTNWINWPGYEKVELVVDDARNFKPHEPVDYMYLDIWSKMGSSETFKDVKLIQGNVKATSLGWWCQEFDLVDWCSERKLSTSQINRSAYRLFARENNLPVTDQDSLIYPRLALLAVTLQAAIHANNRQSKFILCQSAACLLSEKDPIDRVLRKQLSFQSRFS